MIRRALVLAVIVLILLIPAGAASAHPLGNFTVNTAAHITVTDSSVAVAYAIDMAEIPTFQLKEQLDLGDGPEARAAIESLYGPAIQEDLFLQIDGEPLPLELGAIEVSFQPGQGALEIMRVDASFSAPLPAAEASLEFEDRNFPERIGWREVTLTASEGQGLVDSSVPESSISNGLRSYPDDLLSSPPDVTSATARLQPGAASSGGASPEVDTSPGEPIFGGSFASLVSREMSPGLILGALLLAMGFGALHALGPGHGKTVMAAYLVGADGKARQAVIVGIAVSLMHTTSVVVLGLITLWASNIFTPESVYPWLSLASGVVVLGLGSWLLPARLRARSAQLAARPSPVAASVEVDRHEHGRAHEPAFAGVGVAGSFASPRVDASHAHVDHDHADHDHAHDHASHDRASHGHASHDHASHDHEQGASGAASHARAHALGLDHTHGELPAGVPLLSWKGLGAIALSGGLLPSPTALVVLLGAVALQRVAFGIALVAAFSVGLAAALTVVGLLVLKARDVMQRRGGGRLSLALPVMSAGAILLLGSILTVQALINLPLWS